MFITFEGPEGAGKTTQIAILADRLAQAQTAVTTTRQPGGDRLGTSLRQILLEQTEFRIAPMAELLLMMADRAQSVSEIIRPALDAGNVVICDRYADSSVAYQGYGRGIELDIVHRLNSIATGGLAADLTVLLDIDARAGLQRQTARNRMESAGYNFHVRVRDGFLAIARAEPSRIAVIDGAMPVDSVADAVWRVYEAHHRNSA